MTHRYAKPGAKAAKLAAEAAKQQAQKIEPQVITPCTPACLEIGRQPEHIEFDLSALTHPLSFKPTLSVEDHLYLADELLPNGGVVRASFVIPGDDDDKERSYVVTLAQTDACPPHSATLIVHLLECGGYEHVALCYRSKGADGWELLATRFASDADTWQFSQSDHDRLMAGAESWALQKQLERDRHPQEP